MRAYTLNRSHPVPGVRQADVQAVSRYEEARKRVGTLKGGPGLGRMGTTMFTDDDNASFSPSRWPEPILSTPTENIIATWRKRS